MDNYSSLCTALTMFVALVSSKMKFSLQENSEKEKIESGFVLAGDKFLPSIQNLSLYPYFFFLTSVS